MVVQEDVRLWDSVELLYRDNHFEEAESVIKKIMQDTFRKVDFPDLIRSIDHIQLQDNNISKMRDLDLEIKQLLQQNEVRTAKNLFAEYVNLLLSMVREKNREHLVKQIVAELVDKNTSVNNEGMVYTNKSALTNSKGRSDIKRMGIATYTTEQAAKIMGVSSQTIRRWCDQGYFPGAFQTNGGHWRIPRSHFKVTFEKAIEADEAMKEIDRKSHEAGDVDEFNL